MTTKRPQKTKSEPLAVKLALDYIKQCPHTLTKSAKKSGRPTVMTQETVGKLERAFAYDCTVEEACIYAGISRDTYYAFSHSNPDFSDRIKVLRSTGILVARMTLLGAIQDDPNIALRYLERKCKQEFSPRSVHLHQEHRKDVHSIDPQTEKLIKKAMGGFAGKIGGTTDKA